MAHTGPFEVTRRSGRRVALLARYPDRDPAMPQFIPNLGLYMVEAALRGSALPGLEVKVWDITGGSAERVAAEVAAFDPDVVGCSVFLWSFGFFLDVVTAVKADDPARLIVFGGPSARPVMLDHEPHRKKSAAVDLLVINEGEHTFCEVVDLTDRSPAMLMNVPGLALRLDEGWRETVPRPQGDLNLLASPYDMNLMPTVGLGVPANLSRLPVQLLILRVGRHGIAQARSHDRQLARRIRGDGADWTWRSVACGCRAQPEIRLPSRTCTRLRKKPASCPSAG